MNINESLKNLVSDGVSDIHFKAGRPPLIRKNGFLLTANRNILSSSDTEKITMQLLGSDLWNQFLKQREIDVSYSIPGYSRFRVSAFRQRGSVSVALRIIPHRVPTLSELLVPPIVEKIANSTRGLILVTGVAGSGKSSTLAAIINYVNENYPYHIITIEDPIEYLHNDNKASIDQREIGVDTGDFTTAFRSALRQDPDIIMVGELRDTQSMQIALRAAETGHLVMSTVHTTDAKETIGRIVDSFPPFQQKQVRTQLAANLTAIISQRLLQRVDSKGLILAAEIMVTNAAIRDFIIDPEKVGEIITNMEIGRDQYGSQTFDQAIMDLLNYGLVSAEEAVKNSSNNNDFRLKLNLGCKNS